MYPYLLIVWVLTPIVTVSAQSPSVISRPAELPVSGAVLDPSGAPIIGANVTANTDEKRQVARTLSDSRGEFTLMLRPGTYVLRISADGFDEVRHGLVVTDERTAAPPVVLQVSGVREDVLVQAREPISSSTKAPTALRDVPQSVTMIDKDQIRDQAMASIADVVRYVPGISAHQGENNRDDVIIRGNRSSADFFVNGVRDDVQYYRDLYNVERIEALKGPNALLFGRGGGGGVVNRVLKEPQVQPLRAVTMQVGSFQNGRVTADFGQPLGPAVSFRVNGMVQRSESFRSGVTLKRQGVNPTLTFNPGSQLRVTASYEFLQDRRVADRGITSFQGRPAAVDRATFYGDPGQSAVRADAHLASALVERQVGVATIRNRTLAAGYDRFYQNFVPGAASPDASLVTLSAYNNGTKRNNLFNQTDVVVSVHTGPIRHALLTGIEVGRQRTDNFRQTGFFADGATTLRVPFDHPTISAPLTFRQNATDADNHIDTHVAAAFVQDQMELSRYVHLLAGARIDRFDLRYTNRRTGDSLRRADNLFSPRAGLIIKPVPTISIYGGYSASHLPSSGDQFSSLTTVTQQVKPEHFDNYEAGAKWDYNARLSLTASMYRLDRTNTRSTDPNDVTRIVQTGSQRTKGVEVGVNGQFTRAWRVSGGYAYQDAVVTSATTAAVAGARVGQVPRHTASLWNQYQITKRLGAAVGVIQRSKMFATLDNTVLLRGYTSLDAAGFVSMTGSLRLQVNIDNLLNAQYFRNADSNTNISPGGPRALRVALNTRF